jgi:hypothetical protein
VVIVAVLVASVVLWKRRRKRESYNVDHFDSGHGTDKTWTARPVITNPAFNGGALSADVGDTAARVGPGKAVYDSKPLLRLSTTTAARQRSSNASYSSTVPGVAAAATVPSEYDDYDVVAPAYAVPPAAVTRPGQTAPTVKLDNELYVSGWSTSAQQPRPGLTGGPPAQYNEYDEVIPVAVGGHVYAVPHVGLSHHDQSRPPVVTLDNELYVSGWSGASPPRSSKRVTKGSDAPHPLKVAGV